MKLFCIKDYIFYKIMHLLGRIDEFLVGPGSRKVMLQNQP